MCRHFMEKLQQTINQNQREQRTEWWANRQPLHSLTNSQRTKETLGLYIYIYTYIYIYIYIQEANKLNKIRYKLTTNTTGDRKWHKRPRQGTENATKTRKRWFVRRAITLIFENQNKTEHLKIASNKYIIIIIKK